MEAAIILLVEGNQALKNASFAEALQTRYQLQLMRKATQLEKTRVAQAQVAIVNAATMRTTGERVCSTIKGHCPEIPVIHIKKTEDAPTRPTVADMVLVMPFTPRKLINRVERFLETVGGEVIQAGAFELHRGSRLFKTPLKEKRLTPKMAILVEMFLRSPNQVLRREDLMANVWETDYFGDTRTLDVHIRWLREAIEPNPSKPQFLKTVRGVGYRLHLDD